MLLNYYLVFSFNDCFKQAFFSAIEGQAATQQDEENDTTAPNIHRFPIGFSFHHLRGHEVRSAHPAYGTDNMSRVSIHSNTYKRAVADSRFKQSSSTIMHTRSLTNSSSDKELMDQDKIIA
jgi:hypothetical protein